MNSFNACASCKSTDNASFTFWCIEATGNKYVLCKNCRTGGASIPDVWYGYGSGVHTEENIADPKTGKPIPFYDKTSKAAAMRQAGVRESGDRVHGARNEEHLKRRTYI